MTAETAAMIMMGGGSMYTNEQKIITENGIYVPGGDVRWDKVTVDVDGGALSGGVVEIVKNFNPLADLQLPDNYKIDVCVDLNHKLSLLGSPYLHDSGNYNYGEIVFNEEENKFEVDKVNITYVPKNVIQITRVYKANEFQFALWSGNSLLNDYEQYGSFEIYPDIIGGLASYPCDSKVGLFRKYKTKEIHCVPNGYGNIFSFYIRRDSSNRIQSVNIQASAKAKRDYTERQFSDNANGEINKYHPVRYDIISTVTEEEKDVSLNNCITSSSSYGISSNMITTLGTMSINKAVGGFIIAVARYLGYTYYDNFDYNELI